MKKRVRTLDAQDTAFILRKRLGALRAWPDFLADCIRHRTHICGLTLQPVCKARDERAMRPRYALTDIAEFIHAVLALGIGAGPEPIQAIEFEIDDSCIWKLNRFDKHGRALMRISYPH